MSEHNTTSPIGDIARAILADSRPQLSTPLAQEVAGRLERWERQLDDVRVILREDEAMRDA